MSARACVCRWVGVAGVTAACSCGPGGLLPSLPFLCSHLKPAHRLLLRAAQSTKNTQERIAAAREHYKLVLGRNQSEVARLNMVRAADFRRMLHSFAAAQAQLNQAASDVWASVAEHYGQQGGVALQ